MKCKILVLLCLYFYVLSSCVSDRIKATVDCQIPQVPVLTLKDDNTILTMNLMVEDSSEFMVKSIKISLDGTTDLNDIESLLLLYVGQDKMDIQFGKVMPPSAEIIFNDQLPVSTDTVSFRLSVKLKDTAGLLHRINASCEYVATSSSIIKNINNDNSDGLRMGVALRQHNDDHVHTFRIPGLTITNNGTLLAIYDARWNSSRDLQGDIDIGLSRSTDGGATWEPMRIGLDMGKWGGLPEKFNGVSDPCILVDENSDKIFLTGLWMYGVLDDDGKWIEGLDKNSDAWNHQWRKKGSQPGFDVKQTAQFIMSTSTDDGKTWGKPVNLTRMCKKKEWWLWAPAPGHGITMEDGTFVFPTQGRDKTGESFSNITYSIDGGKSWQTSQPAYSNTTENMVAQLSDGRIMLNARYNPNRSNQTDTNGRVVVTTDDLGKTWTEHSSSRSGLIESTCMASLHKHVYHENGKEKSILLFSNPNTKKGRHHMTIKVSFDDGETWPQKYWLLLDEGKCRGYSCITSIDENTVGVLYESSQADLAFQKIKLTDLINKY